MGSNMAENHPVGFQWVMEARERGAQIIHVDPRFTRTSAMATKHVTLRAGSDIAFLGAIVNYILTNNREFREYVIPYTNAATIIEDAFRDTEDLGGLFSGFDPQTRTYDISSWQYKGMELHAASGQRFGGSGAHSDSSGGHGAALSGGEAPHRDETLQHPNCVFQLLKKHYARYTPEFVEDVCGVPKDQFVAVAEALCQNSGRERTGAIVYALGWTHHSNGVQHIRTAAIIQLLLGNMGRPGGGIMALRGHASIQGSTDIPTLYDLLPGYLPMPNAMVHDDLASYVEAVSGTTSFWGYTKEYMVSLLKAYFGENATAQNDFCFDHIPRITGDHSLYTSSIGMIEGKVRGYLISGENMAVGSANGSLQRRGLANLEWLVVRDFFEIETASYWYDSPEIESGELAPERIKTEVFFMPAAAHTEKSGTFTNTQRLLQWRDKAVEPQGDARSELWFYYHLGKIIREKLADSTEPGDQCLRDLAWDYPTEGATDDPMAEAILREINGTNAQGKPIGGYTELKADGSTSCGCWIYAGCFKDGVNQTARRKPGSQQSEVAPEWGWAWPANRRMLYNRASADPDGKPWSERKKYVWWDEASGKWTGHDVPDFVVTMRPDYVPPEGAKNEKALSGKEPFIMQADGVGWLFAPDGIPDGPFPTHYEAHESPLPNALYPDHPSNPARQIYNDAYNPYNPSHGEPHTEMYPFVMTSYRLTEHLTSGAMTRNVSYLSELQPEMFCEISPELAILRNINHGDWATISTSRTSIEARVLVTDRMRPLRLGKNVIHQVGLPFHWGSRGIVTGDSTNDLFSIVTDPNVHIQETKAATCDIEPGRRLRGPALLYESEARRDVAGVQGDTRA
jgi:formate dehydrogenase major subunit